MADAPQCFRCGEYGHVQLACQNEVDPEARKTINFLSRSNRSKAKNAEYKIKWDLRKECLNTFNGNMELLNQFVNGSIDLLYEAQLDLDGIIFDDISRLPAAAVKLRDLKSKLELKLDEFRELVYLGKYYQGELSNRDELAIFHHRVRQLEKLRNTVWNKVWKMDKQAAYAEELIGLIKEEKRMVMIYAKDFKEIQGLGTERILWLFEKMKEHEANVFGELQSLFALVKDSRIQIEIGAFRKLFRSLTEYAAADHDQITYDAFATQLEQFQDSPFAQ